VIQCGNGRIGLLVVTDGVWALDVTFSEMENAFQEAILRPNPFALRREIRSDFRPMGRTQSRAQSRPEPHLPLSGRANHSTGRRPGVPLEEDVMLRKLALAFSLAAFAAQPAGALVINLTADIDGAQEVPVTDSLAFGTGVFTYDDVENVLTWTILYTAALFDTPEILAHIHGPAEVGQDANPVIDLPLGQLKEDTTDLDGLATCPVVQDCEDDLLGGLWYVNIHSEEHTGGEIRGQILPIPEPTVAALLLVAGAGFVTARRLRI
jgi:hypothetical protein